MPTAELTTGEAAWHSQIGIPVRNLWMLLVYASDLARFLDPLEVDTQEDAELPDILARLLVAVVERRLRRSLSRGYQTREEVLSRVRGRIDWLRTETGLLLRRGQVACRFEELTHDTPRNRLVRTALEAMRDKVADRGVAMQCGRLVRDLQQAGVSQGRPDLPPFRRTRRVSRSCAARLARA